jgi:hypothetical protein
MLIFLLNVHNYYRIIIIKPLDFHVTWVPVTTAWRILRLRMEETASREGGQL